MTSHKPKESQVYSLHMRGTKPDLDKVKLYTGRKRFDVDKLVSFDIEDEGYSALSYFMGSILSSVIWTFQNHLKQKKIDLDEIEGVIEADLQNPLRLIPVRGYDQPAQIRNIKVKIYYYADDDEEKLDQMARDCQVDNPIFQLVNQSSPIELEPHFIL